MHIDKQPGEKLPLTKDFSPTMGGVTELLGGSSSITVIRLSDGVDVTSSILVSGSMLVASPRVTGTFQAGDPNQRYKITWFGRTTNFVFEAEDTLFVKEI